MESEILCEATNQNNDEVPKTPRSKAQNSLLSYASNTGRSKRFLCSSHLQSNHKNLQTKGEYVISYNFDHTQKFKPITRNIFIGWDDEPKKKSAKKVKSSNPSSTNIGFHSKKPVPNRMGIFNKIISQEQQKQNNTQEGTIRANDPKYQKIGLAKLPIFKKPTQSNYYSHRQQKKQNKNTRQALLDNNRQNNNQYSTTFDNKNSKTKSNNSLIPIVHPTRNSAKYDDSQQNIKNAKGNGISKHSMSATKQKIKNNQQPFQLVQNKLKLPSFENGKDKKLMNDNKLRQSQVRDYKKPEYRNGKTIQKTQNTHKTLHNQHKTDKRNPNTNGQKQNSFTLKESAIEDKNQKTKNIAGDGNEICSIKNHKVQKLNKLQNEVDNNLKNGDMDVYGVDTMKLIQQLEKMQSEHIMKVDKQRKETNQGQQKQISFIMQTQKEVQNQKHFEIAATQQPNKIYDNIQTQDKQKNEKDNLLPKNQQKQNQKSQKNHIFSPTSQTKPKKVSQKNKQKLDKQILSPNFRKNNHKAMSLVNQIALKQKIRKPTDVPPNNIHKKGQQQISYVNNIKNQQQNEKQNQKKQLCQILQDKPKMNNLKNIGKQNLTIQRIIYKKPLLSSFIQEITQQNLQKSIQCLNKVETINETQNENKIKQKQVLMNNIKQKQINKSIMLQLDQIQETQNVKKETIKEQSKSNEKSNVQIKQKVIVNQIPSKSRYLNKKSSKQKGELQKGIQKKQLNQNIKKKVQKGQLERGSDTLQIQDFTEKLKKKQSVNPKKSNQFYNKIEKIQKLKTGKKNYGIKQLKTNNIQEKKNAQSILNQENKQKKNILDPQKAYQRQCSNQPAQKNLNSKNNLIKNQQDFFTIENRKQELLQKIKQSQYKQEILPKIEAKIKQNQNQDQNQYVLEQKIEQKIYTSQKKTELLCSIQTKQINQNEKLDTLKNQKYGSQKQKNNSQKSDRSKYTNKSQQSTKFNKITENNNEKPNKLKQKSQTFFLENQKSIQKKFQKQKQNEEKDKKIQPEQLKNNQSKKQLKNLHRIQSKAAINKKKQSVMKKQLTNFIDKNLQQQQKLGNKQNKSTKSKKIQKQKSTNSIQSIINKFEEGQKEQQIMPKLSIKQNQAPNLKVDESDSQQQLIKNVEKSEAPKEITCINKKDSERLSASYKKQNIFAMQQLQKQLRMNKTASAPGGKRLPYNEQQTKPIIIKEYCCASVQAGQQLLQNGKSSIPLNVDVGTSVRQLEEPNQKQQAFPHLQSKIFDQQNNKSPNKLDSLFYQNQYSFGNISCEPKIQPIKKESFLQFDNQILNKTDFPQSMMPKQQRRLNANCLKNIKQNKFQFERAPILQYIYGEQKKIIQKQINSYQISTTNSQISFTQQMASDLQQGIIGKATKIILSIDPWLINRIIQPYTSIDGENQVWLCCKGKWKSFKSDKHSFQPYTFLESVITKACHSQYGKTDIKDLGIQQIIRMVTGLRVMQLKNKKKLSHQLEYYLKRGNIIKGISSNPDKPVYNIIGIQTTPQSQKLIQIEKQKAQDSNQQDIVQWIKQGIFQKYFDTFLLICYRQQSFWTYKQLSPQLIKQTLVYTLDELKNSSGSLELNCDSQLNCKIDLYRQVKPKLLKFIGSLSERNKPNRTISNPNPSICFNFSIKGRYYLLINFSDIPNTISKNKMHLSLQCSSQVQIQFLQSIQNVTLKNSTSEYVEINNKNNKSMHKDKDKSILKSKNNSFTDQSSLNKENLREQFISYLLGKGQSR